MPSHPEPAFPGRPGELGCTCLPEPNPESLPAHLGLTENQGGRNANRETGFGPQEHSARAAEKLAQFRLCSEQGRRQTIPGRLSDSAHHTKRHIDASGNVLNSWELVRTGGRSDCLEMTLYRRCFPPFFQVTQSYKLPINRLRLPV